MGTTSERDSSELARDPRYGAYNRNGRRWSVSHRRCHMNAGWMWLLHDHADRYEGSTLAFESRADAEAKCDELNEAWR